METKFLRTKVVYSLAASNVALCLFVIILLAVMNPSGDHATNANAMLFKEIILSVILICTIILLPLYILTWRRLSQVLTSINNDVTQSFSRRVGVFSIVLIVIFMIRIILEIVLLFVTFKSEIVMRSLEFLINSFPELVLTYCFIGLTWKGITTIKSQDNTELTATEL